MFEKVKMQNDYEQTKLNELIESLELLNNAQILEDVQIALSLEKQNFINFARFCEILVSILKAYAKENTKFYKIKQSKISAYEEEYLLTKYVFYKDFNSLPKWFLNLF